MTPKRAAWSYSLLPNLERSGTVKNPSFSEAPGLSKLCSNEWNAIVFGTLIFSTIPWRAYAPKVVESRSTVKP